MPTYETNSDNQDYDKTQNPGNRTYNPPNAGSTDYEKTLMEFKNTQMANEGNDQQFKKTMIDEENAGFKTTGVNSGNDTGHPFKRTSIVNDESSKPAASQQTLQKRKLVGWLVTFSHDEYGQDHKLYAGKNKIGSAPGSDVMISDSSISGDHLIILFRENEFLFKDNFSTNGTKVNGVTTDEGKLKEGDELKLGDTALKFKTVF